MATTRRTNTAPPAADSAPIPGKTPSKSVATKAANSVAVSAREALRQQVADIKDRIGAPGGDKIQCTQDKMFKLPDGTESAGPFKAIIVDFVSVNIFYEGAYNPNNISPPACFSISPNPLGMVPSGSSPVQQASNCTACPMNAFGSDGNGKACKNTRLLALMAPDAGADDKLAILSVPPTALKAFDSYVAKIARKFETPPIGVITEISFDENLKYPSVRFGNEEPIDDEMLAMAMSRQEEARARLLTEPDVSQYQQSPPPAKAGRGKAPVAGARR